MSPFARQNERTEQWSDSGTADSPAPTVSNKTAYCFYRAAWMPHCLKEQESRESLATRDDMNVGDRPDFFVIVQKTFLH
ncbi:hypothetical protein [uncultured Treponema sp.]|uniref:hypothetical protein n=1 Tax=uncultured Treponema sp. TaxID=162155 RepID=UPI0025F705A9|nr:hypothetical protein [uncultured Treponema sp.]